MPHKRLAQPPGDLIEKALGFLQEHHSITDAPGLRQRIDTYIALLDEWAEPLSLLSAQDRERLAEHVVDSLSLVPYVLCHPTFVDIGSGGGLPALPIAAALPGLPTSLIERSAKKAGFLRKAVARLGLSEVFVHHGSYPAIAPSLTHAAITARAMEAPDKFYPVLKNLLSPGSRLLYQGAANPVVYFPRSWISPPIEDIWTAQGLRRGSLYLIEPA